MKIYLVIYSLSYDIVAAYSTRQLAEADVKSRYIPDEHIIQEIELIK